ncbi:type II toxin-antitoxin system HicB family antitoxin [Mycolicibacterium sp.]|uniref:type II toxin-antitoxin system HicB family antitoxin n=1 Tax=Mycolicibacterium sp. TaxID=2320850 RepID=UPI00355E0325
MSNHYTYRAEWSSEDNEYIGLVAEFPSLSWLAPTAAEAIGGVAQLVDDILADMVETGETPPTPLTERRYSGNLSVRTSPDQHRRLAIEAAEQKVSVNQWINQKLAAHGT